MSADAFKCPPPPTSSSAERVSTMFTQKDVQVISAELDEEEVQRSAEEVNQEGERDEDDLHNENHVAQGIVAEYLLQIHQAYRRCFAKAVYTHLRSHGHVAPHDFSSYLEVLHSSHLDIDLSEFLQVISTPKPLPTRLGPEDVQDKFSAEIAHYFARVPLPDTPYYFYHRLSREDAKQTNGYNQHEYEDEDETYGYDKKADMEYDYPHPDVHATSSLELCPPFIGEMEGDIDSKDSLGIYSLPLLLRMEVVRGEEPPEVITAIPTSNMGPTTLRFVCLVLPPLLGPAKLVHESICTVLHKYKKRIVALLSAKILSSLLSIRPLSDPMLDIVKRHLASLAPPPTSHKNSSPSHFVHCSIFELHFVDRREGNILFPQELKTSKPTPLTSANNPALTLLSGDLYTLATRPPTSVSGDSLGDESSLAYWLLLVCKMDAVVATLFSPQVQGALTQETGSINGETAQTTTIETRGDDSTWKGIKAGIAAVSRRVNQMILLYHLHESRVCAELLLPSESTTPQTLRASMGGKDEKGDGKGRVTNFRPGEFECPLVHTISLPLHDRVTPSTARALMLNALHMFEVANHDNLFVYHQKNSRIFYICLRTSVAIQSSTQPSDLQQTSPPPSPSLPTQGPAFITLNVYGVDPAGPEITQHLHQLLENKLSSNTLSILSALFMRNPLLKLTTEDLDFLRPPPSIHAPTGPKTSQAIAIQIPTFVEDPYIFLLFLKHNLMQFLQPIHLSQAAQQREDSEVSSEPNPTHERIDIRPSEFMLMYNHISSNTSTLPFTTIGQGMACIALALLDTSDVCMTATTRPSTLNHTKWNSEELQITLVPNTSQATHSAISAWSHRVHLRIWCRGSVNIPALINHLVLCANQTLCEYVLETSLLIPSLSVSLETLPSFMHYTEVVLSRARALSTPSVYEHTLVILLPSWASLPFLADLRDAIADSNSVLGLQVFTCHKDMDGLHCIPNAYSNAQRNTESGGGSGAGGCDCDDDECSHAASTSDFYHYDVEPLAESTEGELGLASAMMTQRAYESSFFILGGKKVEPMQPAKQSQDHPPALFYPPIKDVQLSEPIIRQCVVAVRLDTPRAHEQGYKMSIHTYNWDQTKLDNFRERCLRLISLYNLRQYLVGTITHHKLGLFQHQPLPPHSSAVQGFQGFQNGQVLSRLAWENIETIIAPQPLTKRRTTSASGNQDVEKHKEVKDQDREPLELDYKKMRFNSHRPVRPTLDFDTVFRDHYPPASAISTLYPIQSIKDPVLQLANQSRTLAMHIEQRAARRTAAIESISILPNPSSGTPSTPLTSFQLDSVINIARLVHFRCVPFLFGDQLMEFGSIHPKPSLPILDAFVRDYIEYLAGLGVTSLLVEKGTSTAPTKRVSTRAYLQKVFLDGTLLVKISFREASVACELFAVPQLNFPAQPPHPTRHFGEELTRFTRILHLNSFTYDFHVNQLYRMIKFPYIPTPATSAPLTQSISSILQALHQYYPTPPIHASTCLDSFSSSCPVVRLSPEIPEITTNQILEFMMLDPTCIADSITPLRHVGIHPALLLHVPTLPPYSDLCSVIFAKEALQDTDQDCGCGNPLSEKENEGQLDVPNERNELDNVRLLSLHIFVVKVGEVCITGPSNRIHNPPPSDNSHVVDKLHKATATSSINYQRNLLWNKLQRGNPYSPALTHSEFRILTQLVLSRPATLLDPTLVHPVNLLKFGSSVWHQLLAQLRTVGGERVRQVFADPIHHLLIFHPTNSSQLVHFVWNEAEKEALILLCRLDGQTNVGDAMSDGDEMLHLSQLVTMICHFIWKLFLVKQPF